MTAFAIEQEAAGSDPPPRRPPPNRWRLALSVTLALLLLEVVFLRFAQPIEDGDLFWHMAYGSQMIEHRTLQTDHTLYSWMPASNTGIYCAWLSELLLLGVWKLFGMAGIFALRYAAILAVVVLLAIYARRRGMLARPEAWLVFLIVVLASAGATFPKPEMLSLVLWNALLFCYFGMLLAVEDGRDALRWIYAIPALMLVWVNAHGGFMLAAPFFAVTGVAAWLTLPKREARHIAIAWGATGLATVATPYGVRYPIALVNYALGRLPHPDTAWNNAYQPTFGSAGQFHHLPELFLWMTAMLLIAGVMRRRSGLRNPNLLTACALFLAYLPLSILYVRSAFLLPAIFGYAFFALASGIRWQAPVSQAEPVAAGARVRRRRTKRPAGHWAHWQWPRWDLKFLAPAAALILFAFLGARAVYQARFRPETNTWMGFGVSYFEPVEEAEFLRQGNFGPRVYNTFNIGGYLLWSLFPRYKVMVDARSFPYLAWFDELYKFTRTENPREFQAFLDRHPADVAVVDFEEGQVWRSFLRMPGWRPAFYGASAAVFVPARLATGPLRTGRELQHLRNGAASMKVFDFAVNVGDYHTAWKVLDQMAGPLRREVDPETLAAVQSYRQGHTFLRAIDYRRAYDCFESAFEHRVIGDRDNKILLFLRALNKLQAAQRLDIAPKIRAALALLTAPE